MSVVDHLVYVVPDLEAGVEHVASLLHVRAAPGGQHPGRGTRNALLSLGPRCYLEIIGPDPERATAQRWFPIGEVAGPKLMTWAAAASDLDARVAAAAEAGISLGPVGEGRRARADGTILSWRFTDPAAFPEGGVIPFLIDWGSSPHPADAAPGGATLVQLRAEHPDPGRVQALLERLGTPIPVGPGTAPALVAVIGTRYGEIELR